MYDLTNWSTIPPLTGTLPLLYGSKGGGSLSAICLKKRIWCQPICPPYHHSKPVHMGIF